MYQKVVCAVDGSPESSVVLAAAKELADDGANLTLLLVVRPFSYAYAGLDMMVPSRCGVPFEEEAVTNAMIWLDEVAKQYELNCDRVVLSGIPSVEIREYAAEHQADLVLMGSHGRGGLRRLLGSTANAVLHGTPCDTMIVHTKEAA